MLSSVLRRSAVRGLASPTTKFAAARAMAGTAQSQTSAVSVVDDDDCVSVLLCSLHAVAK